MTVLTGSYFTWNYKGKRRKYYQGLILCQICDGYGSVLWSKDTRIDRLNKEDAIQDCYELIKRGAV
jgi:hypothetical protein